MKVSLLILSTLAMALAEPPSQYLPPNQYIPPPNQYLPPTNNYLPPVTTSSPKYLPPTTLYGTPTPSPPVYRPPTTSYGTPIPTYGAPYPGRGGYDDESSQEPANYEFEYHVQDPPSGNDFGHKEQRQGDVAQGRYFVLLPDGRLQTVEYIADADGYKSKVSYQQVGGGYPTNNGGYPANNGGYQYRK
ncbi:pro-resilin-like isoform X1 [Euwallacea fornicatus]|uniref:pro-resilin-like isoform X1 n=1 Tax=Euwallacea fornicatus TaxID=995702 RepID=UPI00338E05DF